MAFDTKQFQYKDISLIIDGEDITGFTNIKFKSSREKEFLRGKGDEPYEIQHGNKSYEGEIGLWQSTLENLIRRSPNGDITLLRVEVVVMFAQQETAKLSGYRLGALEFTDTEIGMSQGDKFAEITLPIMFLGLKKIA